MRRPQNPTLTGLGATALAYFVGRWLGLSRFESAGVGALALVVHDRYVDGMWPWRQPLR